jgi:hypothetical protein
MKTIVEFMVKPTAEQWLTPTPTSILLLEVNIKKQKRFFNIYLHIWVTMPSEPILPTAQPNAEPTTEPTIDTSIKTTADPTVKLTTEQWPTPILTGFFFAWSKF